MANELSKAARLYVWLESIEPGQPIYMKQMLEVTDGTDQEVRNYLSQIRNGRVPHPEHRGKRLPELPIYYHRQSGAYYRSDRTTTENVEEAVPQETYASLFQNVLTRVRNLRDGFVEGLGTSIEERLISDQAVRQLLMDLGERRLWLLNDDIQLLLRAYGELRQLQLEGREFDQLPPPTETEVVSDEKKEPNDGSN